MKKEYKLIQAWLNHNRYSRPGKSMGELQGIVIHWVGNPNTSARNNRDYFNGLQGAYASSHEIIGLEGEVVLCIPENEVAYHVGSKTYTRECLERVGDSPNYHLYGIECCHLDWDGLMTSETYKTLVLRVADLCFEWQLDPLHDVWLHQEVVGWKDCHRWFVRNPAGWEEFKKEVMEVMADKVLQDWQKQLGIESVKELSDGVGIDLLQNPRQWEDKLAEHMPNWLAFTLFARLAKQLQGGVGK